MQDSTKKAYFICYIALITTVPITCGLIFVSQSLNSVNTTTIVESVDQLSSNFNKIDKLNENVNNLTNTIKHIFSNYNLRKFETLLGGVNNSLNGINNKLQNPNLRIILN